MDSCDGANGCDEVVPLWNPSYSFYIPMVLRTAVEINIFKIIEDSGADAQLSLSEIASGIPTDDPKSLAVLENILRLLSVTSYLSASFRPSSSGLSTHERTYGMTEQSRLLLGHKTDAPFSAFVVLGTEREICERLYELKDVVIDPERNSFGGKEGKGLFQIAESNPRFGRLFNETMSVSSHIVVSEVIKAFRGFDQLTELMDVAGGIGTGLAQIIFTYPHIHGINFDLPSVIDQAPKHPGIKYVEGDMFQTLPKAQNIWMKWILHNWDDVMCEKLLRNCWEALPEDGRVMIVEYVLPEDPEDEYKAKAAVLLEMHMMVLNLEGKERTRTQFERLAKVTGFPETNFVPIFSGFYLIEFFKKPTVK